MLTAILTHLGISSMEETPQSTSDRYQDNSSTTTMETDSLLLKLPSELIHHVLTFLPQPDLAQVSLTCRLLCEHADDDRLWHSFLEETIQGLKLPLPSPGPSYRQQYLLHHPYWFLPKYKIWYSDTPHTGRLLIARYSAKRQTIEAYALAAERVNSGLEFWDWNPDVIIHRFDPKIRLDLNQAVIKIDADAVANLPLRKRFSEEVVLNTHSGIPMGGINSRLSLTRPLPEQAISSGTQVWPPQKLPATSRVRNASLDGFRGTGHTPTRMSELSEHTFRLRRWMDFPARLQGFRGMTMRMGEDVSTFATLPPEAYTPTQAKPWRGIWCGDYSGHGCEFLVILQPDEDIDLPEGAKRACNRRRHSSVDSTDGVAEADFDYEHLFEDTPELNLLAEMPLSVDAEFVTSTSRADEAVASSSDEVHEGQLLAVKLTGDPNIPRGEYTFLAPDISDAALLRAASEDLFKGARIVRSAGHIAARDFRDGMYLFSRDFVHCSSGVYLC